MGDDADGAGFADFIVGEVYSHRSAEKLLANVQDVLDEDAVTFVMQLFKVSLDRILVLSSPGFKR